MPLSNNPLMDRSDLPHFDVLKPEHFTPALKETFKRINEKLNKIEANIIPTWEGLCRPLEELMIDVECTWNVLEHLISVKNSAGMRKAQKECMPEYVGMLLHMQQSKPIYEGLKKLKASEEYKKSSSARRRVIDKKLKAAENAGVGLEGHKKERFNKIYNRIKALEGDFTNNLIDSTKNYELVVTDIKETEGWPISLLRMTARNYADTHGTSAYYKDSEAFRQGPWSITLDRPCMQPFMANCKNRQLRHDVHNAFINRASSGENNNTPIIEELLKLRKEEATILGYNNFAELSLSTKMAQSPEKVFAMIDELEKASKPYAEAEYKEISDLAKENGFTETLQEWDVPYWAERLKEQRFGIKEDSVRPYLSFKNVLNGLFSLCNRLFGISVKENPSKDIPKWHEDVKYFDIFDENNKEIAHFYLDPFGRPSEKRGGAWMEICSSRRIINGVLHNPIIYVECNGTPPVAKHPSLMSFYEVNTLFHEFGHALQGMLTTVDEPEVGGANGIEWDAVEVASQFMENWCANHDTLASMAKHFATNEPMPEEILHKLIEAKKYRGASKMLRQLSFAKADMYLHTDYDPEGKESVFDAYYKIASETMVTPANPQNKFLCAFNHIFGGEYCAGYYCYKWAEVLSADAFAAFEEVGLDNDEAIRAKGREYRNTILALGGSKSPSEVFRMFRGRDANTDAILRHTLK